MALAPSSSEEAKETKETPPPSELEAEGEAAADLEDGEIEDDDEEVAADAAAMAVDLLPPPPPPPPPDDALASPARADKRKEARHDDKKADAKKKKHLTEAEKSVLKLHKMERLEREKRDKYRRDQLRSELEPVDDYAVSLEKALAKVLRKDGKSVSDEDEEAKRSGRKRKRKEKAKKAANAAQPVKRSRQASPKNAEDDIDEQAHKSEEESSDTESSSERSEARRRAQGQRAGPGGGDKRRERSRERTGSGSGSGDKRAKNRSSGGGGSSAKNKRNVGICLYYLQGKCADDNCKFSHDCVQPLKLELCKFYQLDCCAKGDKCLYMHSDFPCRYYHTGIPCPMGDDCKFAHGGPLPESVRQILFKHIETAPKEILGNFPRLSRENAHMMITQAQKNLDLLYNTGKEEGGGSGSKSDNESDAHADGSQDGGDRKEKRNRPSRWQDPEPEKPPQPQPPPPLLAPGFGLQPPPAAGFHDQDMRVNSNGDIDMRTIPPLAPPAAIHPTDIANPHIFTTSKPPPPILGQELLWLNNIDRLGLLNSGLLAQAGLFLSQPEQAGDDAAPPAVVDIEQYKMDAAKSATGSDTDIRPKAEDDEDNALHIVMEDDKKEAPASMPKTQRDLFQRIQQQQKLNAPLESGGEQLQPDEEDAYQNDWYSDDEDDENKLTIEHEDVEEEEAEAEEEEEEEEEEKEAEKEKEKEQEEEDEGAAAQKEGCLQEPPDLSKIDIPAEVSKLLSSLQGSGKPKDPRLKTAPAVAADEAASRDPRLARLDAPPEPMTIYEQSADRDAEQRLGRADVDLRAFAGMPFKRLANYTPACEIDASVAAHPAMAWRVAIVDVPKPDYTGLKLSASDAQTSGDPRLRKIFRLSTEEKDSPASPSASPKGAGGVPTPRVDPRRKRDAQPLTYAQQVATLQASPFYQSLTSNQKLSLNQELAGRNDQTGACDPIVSAMLTSLGLQAAHATHHTPQQAGQAMSILNALTQFGAPMLAVPAALMSNPPPNLGQGLLGPAPPHLQDFGMPFGGGGGGGGLLGNAPPMAPFGGSQEFGAQPPGNYSDDFYEHSQGRRRGSGGPAASNGRNASRNGSRSNYFRRQNKNRHRNSSPS